MVMIMVMIIMIMIIILEWCCTQLMSYRKLAPHRFLAATTC